MKLAVSILLAAAMVAPLSAHALRPAADGVSVAILASADARRVALQVEGMTCGGCAISARVVLNRLDGVKKADVDYEKKRATVTYDPAKVTPPQMITALKQKLGYTAHVIEAGAK